MTVWLSRDPDTGQIIARHRATSAPTLPPTPTRTPCPFRAAARATYPNANASTIRKHASRARRAAITALETTENRNV